jgi:DNA-binding NarL/FixJ family response regulator
MAISRGRELVSQSNPDPDEVRKSIAALHKDSSHVQKCINAGLRDYISGEATIKEISDLIQQLEQKL